MVRLWNYRRDGGMLPEAGGVMDQAAIMMDAFGVMDAAYYQIKDREQKR